MAASKKKTSPVFYLALIGAGAAIYVYTEPEAATKKKPTTRTSSRTASAPDGFTPEDLSAKFPRYAGPARDAFQPKVVAKKATSKTTLKASPLVLPPPRPVTVTLSAIPLDAWVLTGISLVDGVRSALVENKTTGESVFLRAGVSWNAYKVGSIEPGALVLIGPTGTVKRLGFPAAPPEKVASAAAPAAEIPAPNVVLPNLTPPSPDPTRRRRNNRVRSGDTVAQSGLSSQNGAQP